MRRHATHAGIHNICGPTANGDGTAYQLSSIGVACKSRPHPHPHTEQRALSPPHPFPSLCSTYQHTAHRSKNLFPTIACTEPPQATTTTTSPPCSPKTASRWHAIFSASNDPPATQQPDLTISNRPYIPSNSTWNNFTFLPVSVHVASQGWYSLIQTITQKEQQCLQKNQSMACLRWRRGRRQLAQSTYESYSAYDADPPTFYHRSRTVDPGPSSYFPLSLAL